jgi:ABC-type sugar transport system permease subunit
MTRNPGPWFALPVVLFLLACFAMPIVIVTWYSFMPPRTFDLGGILPRFQKVTGDRSCGRFLVRE